MPEPGPSHHHARPAHALVSLVQTWPLLMSTAVQDRGAVTDLWLQIERASCQHCRLWFAAKI